MPCILFRLCLRLFFLHLHFQIRNIFHHTVDIVQRIRDGFFFGCIHDLLHTLCNFRLKIDGIKPFCVYFYFWNCDRIMHGLPGTRHLLHINVCQTCSVIFCLTKRPILFFLCFRQWLIQHFQFQCTLYIWPVSKPENQLITCINTLLTHPCFVIQISKLICPLFRIFLLLEFFKNRYQFFIRSPLCFLYIIAKYIFKGVMRRNLHKLIIIILCRLKIFHLDRHFRKTVNNHSSDRRAVICHQQNFPALLITLYFFVHFPSFYQTIYIFNLIPIDSICNICCLIVFLFRITGFHLIKLQIIFVFVQLLSP